MARIARSATPRPSTKFYERLVLADWLLAQFGITKFELIRPLLREVEDEGGGEASGVPDFLRVVRAVENGRLGVGALDAIDERVQAIWKSITQNRRQAGGIRPRCLYFQYLALCGSHLYFERLFFDRTSLLQSLNDVVADWNTAHGAGDALAPYTDSDLNKLAFWSATGSGKTLLMHAQMLQYLELEAKARSEGWKDAPLPLDRIFLITPSEALSAQHRDEAALSGLESREFRVGASLFSPQVAPTIETISINRLGDEMGEKVVALSSLEGVNLVLVDEGHRGASGEAWKKRRDALGARGMALEYSATFGQAVGGDNGPLAQEYARCIAQDYSYRRFYEDGYGKDFQIYNLADNPDEVHRDRYMTACALSFLVQRRAFTQWGNAPRFGFQKPLWVFVGGTVNSANTKKQDLTNEEKTDVLEIVQFFARLLEQREQFEAHISALLQRRGELHAGGRDPFAHAFDGLGTDAHAVYDELMQSVFGASGASGLVLEPLKSAEGEIALRAGNATTPFGVINVGNAAKFGDIARTHGIRVEDRALGGSLFETISETDSDVSVLIGARKFSEGWNSFRVSTLGLMKIGRGEGAQIIQLFGRGVRLRGYANSLRRSSVLEKVELPKGAKLSDLAPLETLGVFGLKADYMATFQDALRRDGVPVGEKITVTVKTRPLPEINSLPPLRTLAQPSKKLWRECNAAVIPSQWRFNGKNLKIAKVKADLYPKMQSLHAQELTGAEVGDAADTNSVKFKAEQLCWLDWDAIVAELRQQKETKGWTKLRIERASLEAMFTPTNSDWYELKAPAEFLQISGSNFKTRVRLWQNTVIALLSDACKKLHDKARGEFERADMRLVPLEPQTDGSYETQWTFTIDDSDQKLESELNDLWAKLETQSLVAFGPIEALDTVRHFYSPLLTLGKSDKVKVTPVSLDADEFKFVKDLEAFAASGDEWLQYRSVFLMRNKAKSGIGFYDGSEGFFPDFALWIYEELPDTEPRECLAFIDPKGLVYFEPDDDKVTLHKRIKTEYQAALGETITLNSFLISTTPFEKVSDKWKIKDESELRQLGVFLSDTPIKQILEAATQ
ncbi:MAG TPA: DEAD/DEAH box helicase family protein [Abditibacteriaceae bacterium]|jgi:hypothetical protein